jgi:Fe-S-cluster containining protein
MPSREINCRASLTEIYAALPKVACKRMCQPSCGVVIPAACLPEEQRKLSILPIIKTVGDDFTCGALLYGSCSIYSNRPLVCRLYGCVEAMRCPWGCEPEFWVTDKQVEDILRFHNGHKWIGRLHR